MKSIKKNLIYQSAYQLLMVISPLITSPYIARTLGNEMYGVYSYYYSIAYYFGIFAILGLSNYGNEPFGFSPLLCFSTCMRMSLPQQEKAGRLP